MIIKENRVQKLGKFEGRKKNAFCKEIGKLGQNEGKGLYKKNNQKG